MKFRTKVLITAVLTAAISVTISTSFPTKGKTRSVESTDVHIASAQCLAKNMYYEARNQGTAGWLAVTAVVLNRVNDKRFPNSVCEVVRQGPTRPSWKNPTKSYPIRNRCQFSWYCDGKSDVPRPGNLWKDSQRVAKVILQRHLNSKLLDITDGSTHYHANWMEEYPRWSTQRKKLVSIDQHIFYGERL